MAYELLEDAVPEENKYIEFGKGALRNIGRQGSNLATRAVGLPGDLFSLVNEYIANPVVEKLGGQKVPYQKTILGKILPTTEFHRSGLDQKFGSYLKPQNQVEKFADDIIEDTALLLVPGGKGAKLKSQLPRAFFTSVGANVAGKGAQDISGSEQIGDYTKMGTLFTLSLINPGMAKSKLDEFYDTARKNLPENAEISAKKLENNLVNLGLNVSKGTLAPSEKFVLDEVQEVLKKIRKDKINIDEAWSSKRSLNEKLQKHLYDSPKTAPRARKLAKLINYELNDVLSEYGKKNPAFYKPYKMAEEGYATLANSNFISNWIEKNIKYNPLTSGLIHLFGSGIASKASTAVLPYQGIKLAYRIRKSPTLRKIYLQALRDASNQNSAGFTKHLKHLDEAVQKEENKDRFEFID